MFWLITLHFILVHAPDGQEIQVNVAEISSIRKPREDDPLLAEGVHCAIGMTNAKFISTKESCAEIIKAIAEEDKE